VAVHDPQPVGHERLHALTNDALLQRNVVVNLAAWALPALAALVSIPLLARGLGPVRFGLVTFSWAAIGVGALFDFGLGRSLTRVVSVRLAAGQDHEVGDLVWAASWLLLGLTGVVAIAGWTAAPAIVGKLMKVPVDHRAEAVGVLRLLAAGLPFMAHGVTLRGVLEAGQKFPLSARLRVPMGVVTYAGPLVALLDGGDARIAVGVVVAGRVGYWLAHFAVIGRIAPGLGRPRAPRRAAVREILHVGTWIVVSNIVGPVLANADRLIVASAFPIAASGWYGTASEVATKQFLFTGALQPVLFPALAASYRPAPERAVALMWRATWVTMSVIFCSTMVLAAFAQPLLRLWMRGAYSPVAAEVLPWLAIAVFINCLGQVPFAMLQGALDARGAALMFVAELPIYLGLLAVFGSLWGIRGIAFAWLGRMAVDAVGQWSIMAARFPASRTVARRVAMLATPAVAALVAAALWGAR
jgi:O-antigen/teichoic acid export membrane protein